MLGRVRRPSMNSLEELELERAPPKITKTDPFSIYESTLMKLKEGSQRCQSQRMPPEEAGTTENGHAAPCCSEAINPDSQTLDCSSICQSMNNKNNINTSILHLFTTYKISKNNTSLPDKEAMVTNDQCQLTVSLDQQMQEK